MAKVRLNIEVSADLAKMLDSLADEEVVTRTEIVRRALAVLMAYRGQMDAGRTHIGFTDEPGKLDSELVGVLTPPAKPLTAKQRRQPSEDSDSAA